MRLSQQFQLASGTLRSGPDEIPFKSLELIRGDRLQIIVERFFKGQTQTLRFTGRVQGHFIEGVAEEMIAGSQGRQTWKAKRDPSTMKPLD